MNTNDYINLLNNMSFPTMTFNDLRYTHSKQIYNNSSADKNEDYGEFFNMLSNIMESIN